MIDMVKLEKPEERAKEIFGTVGIHNINNAGWMLVDGALLYFGSYKGKVRKMDHTNIFKAFDEGLTGLYMEDYEDKYGIDADTSTELFLVMGNARLDISNYNDIRIEIMKPLTNKQIQEIENIVRGLKRLGHSLDYFVIEVTTPEGQLPGVRNVIASVEVQPSRRNTIKDVMAAVRDIHEEVEWKNLNG